MSYDFSLSNPALKEWFDNDKGDVPVRQFIYVHEHPLVRPNFVTDIEVLIYETGVHMTNKNIVGAPAKKLSSLAEAFTTSLAAFVTDRTDKTATKVLLDLRNLYQLCVKVKAL